MRTAHIMPDRNNHSSARTAANAVSAWVSRHSTLIPTTGRVLDLACGRGRHTRFLHAQAYEVVAADIDLTGVRDLENTAGIELREIDLESNGWPFSGELFAGIVVTNYLYRPHFPGIVASLVPNGLLIFETFALGNEKYGRPSNPDYLLQQDELLRAFAGSLDVIAFEQALDQEPGPAVRQRICARRHPPG